MVVTVCPECLTERTTGRRPRNWVGLCKMCSNRAITRRREEKRRSHPITTAWSCGGGVQSTAIAALITQGQLPRPDLAVMVDTGWERTSTWEYMQGTTISKLAAIGLPLNIIKTTDHGGDNSIFDRMGYVRIPAYERCGSCGAIKKYRTHCSGEWKLKPMRRWLRSLGVKRCENWLGISTDERKRARPSPLIWHQYRYPLVELGLSRSDCLEVLRRYGWPRPPRTACLMCPSQDDSSWLASRERYPDDWRRAVRVEESIQHRRPAVFLHASGLPLAEAELLFSNRPCAASCGGCMN